MKPKFKIGDWLYQRKKESQYELECYEIFKIIGIGSSNYRIKMLDGSINVYSFGLIDRGGFYWEPARHLTQEEKIKFL